MLFIFDYSYTLADTTDVDNPKWTHEIIADLIKILNENAQQNQNIKVVILTSERNKDLLDKFFNENLGEERHILKLEDIYSTHDLPVSQNKNEKDSRLPKTRMAEIILQKKGLSNDAEFVFVDDEDSYVKDMQNHYPNVTAIHVEYPNKNITELQEKDAAKVSRNVLLSDVNGSIFQDCYPSLKVIKSMIMNRVFEFRRNEQESPVNFLNFINRQMSRKGVLAELYGSNLMAVQVAVKEALLKLDLENNEHKLLREKVLKDIFENKDTIFYKLMNKKPSCLFGKNTRVLKVLNLVHTALNPESVKKPLQDWNTLPPFNL